MTTYNPFQKALPVWPEGREKEMNVTCRFTAEVPVGKAMIRMAGSTVYRVFVNGILASYGPARGPKYYFRVDEFDLTPFLSQKINLVLIEDAGYNSNSFYLLDQPSFLQAEIIQNNEIIAWTAPEGGMPCEIVEERVQKVQRYSFQRPFAESWKLTPSYEAAYHTMVQDNVKLALCSEKTYLPRRVPFASLSDLKAEKQVGTGTVTVSKENHHEYRDRSLVNIGDLLKGYKMEKLDVTLSEDAGHYEFACDTVPEKAFEKETILKNHFSTVKFYSNLTGFIGSEMECKEPATLIFLFDEIYNVDVNFWRMGCVNIVRCDLLPGRYSFVSMEPYTMQYLKMVAFGGDITVSNVRIVEYAAPADHIIQYQTKNPKLSKIWDAAVQTYRQNAVDLYTDCPCRERAGWLCDSFWTARVEYALTGKSVVEKNFLENFLLPESFERIPQGMLPMCYPSDHYDGVYIPNWAMWLVMEVREYLDRSGDKEMVEAFRKKIYDFFAFLDRYKNEDGLLEKLDSWIFVEWSKANELVQDVNFPSNMLYAACKQAAGEMYHDDALIREAETMRSTIRRLSYNGKFFTDHLVRNEKGELVNPGEETEVCQYYAFYLNTATPETYPELWNTLLHDFGPYRKQNNKYPEVYFANAFIGNYLRLDMMSRNDNMREVMENVEGYFYGMAEMTGTLWENDSTVASLDHGFASHVAVWLLKEQKEEAQKKG